MRDGEDVTSRFGLVSLHPFPEVGVERTAKGRRHGERQNLTCEIAAVAVDHVAVVVEAACDVHS